jgi:hypothetical protein
MAIEMNVLHLKDLEISAHTGDRGQFVRIAEGIDWSSQAAEELLRAIDLALSMELADLAIRLAQAGKSFFPDHERMQQAAQVLAPPRVRTSYIPPAKGLDVSAEWLRINANQYRGQWIAIREGQLVGSAHSLQELAAVIQQDPVSTLVTKVL